MSVEIAYESDSERETTILILKAAAWSLANEKISNWSALNIAATLAKGTIRDLDPRLLIQVFTDINFPTKEIGVSTDWKETG